MTPTIAVPNRKPDYHILMIKTEIPVWEVRGAFGDNYVLEKKLKNGNVIGLAGELKDIHLVIQNGVATAKLMALFLDALLKEYALNTDSKSL